MSNALSRFAFPVLLGLAAVVPARAETPPGDRPLVSARVIAALPPGAALSIEPRDDTDANLRLADLMADRLRGQRHPVVADAPLRLRFSAETVSDVGPRAGAATGDTLVARDRTPFGSTNLNYSEADRFFGPSSDRARSGAVRITYQLRATIETRDGKVLWSGQASSPLTERADERGEQRVAAELGDALVDAVGRDVDTRVAAAPVPAPSASPSTSFGALRLPGVYPTLAARP